MDTVGIFSDEAVSKKSINFEDIVDSIV
jgi:hypothetical protein